MKKQNFKIITKIGVTVKKKEQNLAKKKIRKKTAFKINAYLKRGKRICPLRMTKNKTTFVIASHFGSGEPDGQKKQSKTKQQRNKNNRTIELVLEFQFLRSTKKASSTSGKMKHLL